MQSSRSADESPLRFASDRPFIFLGCGIFRSRRPSTGRWPAGLLIRTIIRRGASHETVILSYGQAFLIDRSHSFSVTLRNRAKMPPAERNIPPTIHMIRPPSC
jgi:hypothetical protein